jgi:hypothetical protein
VVKPSVVCVLEREKPIPIRRARGLQTRRVEREGLVLTAGSLFTHATAKVNALGRFWERERKPWRKMWERERLALGNPPFAAAEKLLRILRSTCFEVNAAGFYKTGTGLSKSVDNAV